MIPADYTPLARRAYEGSSSCFGPWEALTPGQRAKWLAVVTHLATPPAERHGGKQMRVETERNEEQAA